MNCLPTIDTSVIIPTVHRSITPYQGHRQATPQTLTTVKIKYPSRQVIIFTKDIVCLMFSSFEDTSDGFQKTKIMFH